MEHVGIDLGRAESQISILTEAGELMGQRLRTERDRFIKVLGDLPRSRILIEASTESEWVARCLEELGHEVIVADPNYAPMYAQRSRHVKTDRRDAEALAQACRLGEWSSSEIQRRGRITKAGNTRRRWLLVEAARCVMRGKRRPETAALREWRDPRWTL